MNYINTYFNYTKRHIALTFTFVFLLIFSVNAQQELPRHYKKYQVSLKANLGQKGSNTYTIHESGAAWLRLFFNNVQLGKKGSITITSKLDGASQTLTAASIQNWKSTSAYFNGSTVSITINNAAGEKGIGIDINEVGIGDLAPSTRSQCGSVDNRSASNDAAIGRIVPIGCTGWIIRNGKFVTAGHCSGSRAQIIEFNVPRSNSNGNIVHPGPEDQYPIGTFVTDYVRGRPETDWAVFTAGANTQTGLTAIQAQGKSFNVVQSAPGNTIRITGFGVDTGRDNQTQQTHTGPKTSFNDTFVRYQTDTEGGNSGSPIIDEATGNAVGVHAYGGCSTSSGSNYGERATIPAFWDAMGLDGNPGGGCTTINFNNFQISSFSTQDISGNSSVNGGGSSLTLRNNTWKSISLNYNVTANTKIEFQFSSSSQGEIHAVGFENDNSLTSSRYFRVYGTQNYGVSNFDNYSGSGTKTYVIPVGSFYTGNMNRLVFINDNDAGSGNNSTFSNVKIYEGSSCSRVAGTAIASRVSNGPINILLGDEDEGLLSNAVVGSNPTNREFTITLGAGNDNAKATLFSVLGQKKGTLSLQSGTNKIATDHLRLTPGIYLIKIENRGETVTKRLVVR